ncbi:MAG TPA: phosphate ABC transporter permease PstA [Thermoplasmata archaeon]|nr:phosphate ABC transporter permease PstA [Thermoplasmata archaeon]
MKLRSLRLRKAIEVTFVAVFLISIVVALGTLAMLLGSVVSTALPYLRTEVVVNYASAVNPLQAGYAAAIVGTLWVVGLTLLFSIPLGVAAGVYLEEYAPRSRLTRFLEAGVANLAGVPSVVFGLLGLALFVRILRDITGGPTVLAGALTMTILVFPYVVITTQEAVRAVPASLREGALALGATKWQAIRGQVLPAGAPGLLTAVILAASRAMGETAPLIVIGATFFQSYLPSDPRSFFVALPVQIYGYVGLPRQDFLDLNRNGILDPGEPLLASGGWPGVAAAGIVILLVILFAFNIVAMVARNRMQRRRL